VRHAEKLIKLPLLALLTLAIAATSVFGQRAPTKGPAQRPKPGTISGRAFGITAGGDLKPARLAKVYLLHLTGSLPSAADADAGNKEDDSAALRWLKDLNRLIAEVTAARMAARSAPPVAQPTLTAPSGKEETPLERVARLAALARAFGVTPAPEETPIERTARLAAQERRAEEAEKRGAEKARSDELAECRSMLLAYDKATLEILTWARETNQTAQIALEDADEEGRFTLSALPGSYLLVVRGRAGFNDASWQTNVTVEAGKETTVKLGSPEQSCLALE
jgi:hypothetical protein